MPAPLAFSIESRSGAARTGRVTTPHGAFDTPAFMPVGTRATVKGVHPREVAASGAQILLNNTYHLLLRPGPELIASLGGVHAFMGWDAPILTDSGGYQAYSLADTNQVDDDGVTFRSVVDGSQVRMTPESAIRTQNMLGADIIMAFDDCPPSIDPRATNPNQPRLRQAAARDARGRAYDHGARLRQANERTLRWLERCAAAHARPDEQALFGIVQGGTDLEARSWCAERACAIDLPGFAVGGVAVGEPHEELVRVVRHTAPLLPDHKPRYLMGVGYERDIVQAVRAGIDMFDCVLPTRNGRNAFAFTRAGPLKLRNLAQREDPGPIEPGCDCPACDPGRHGWRTPGGASFSRAYLRHLFMVGEMLGPILVTLHNLRHFQRLMAEIRGAIRRDDWTGLARDWPVLVGSEGQVAGAE
ncbi:MAG: tRNA guanosine(34) transglycosylase Tgt [Phycisphaerales bacterium]|nr:tRNA guanosine(34) transglycosylase Tgt [Phycisphaerales bacterium]